LKFSLSSPPCLAVKDRLACWVALIVLIVLQIFCYGPIVTHVGFYLDDWATLSFLHFAPKTGGYLGLLHYYLFNDSRVLIRPLEVLHFGTIYYLCGDKPLGYHIVNMIFEIASSLLLYKILVRLTARRAAALIGAIFLLLYPSHDSTRYWVICSSVTLSLLLYLGSLQAAIVGTDCYLRGVKKQALVFQLLGFLLFFLSLLNYEIFLPFAAVTVLVCAAMAWRQGQKFVLPAAFAALPLILGAVALLIYLKVLVPMLGHGYAHAISLEPKVMISTIGQGLSLSMPWQAGPFFLEQAGNAVAVLTSSEKIRLVLIALAGVLPVLWLAYLDNQELIDVAMKSLVGSAPALETSEGSAGEPDAATSTALRPLDLLILSAFAVFLSYTIFGLSPDYMPTFITLVNRVNTGASIGIAIFIAALFQALATRVGRSRSLVVAGVGALAMLLLFTLADWGLSKPWVVSWTTQKEVRQAVSQLKGKIDPQAALLLVSCPRYVMWSPVFDGVWDFQNMVRITLDQPQFNANVVSERMSISAAGIKDVSYGYECGVYPFNKLFLMVAPHPELYPIRSGDAFVDMVEQRGMSFGLDKKTLSKWRSEYLTTKLEPSH
jgi:hypothetical protein